MNFIFRRTKLGQLVDGNKTLIGFGFLVLSQIAELLLAASGLWPDTPVLTQAAEAIIQLQTFIGDLFQSIGVTVMTIGVADKAVKEIEE